MVDDCGSRNQIGANVFNMMLSLCLLLALSSAELLPATLGVSLFLGLSSLAVSSVSVALVASGLHVQLANSRLVQACVPSPSPYGPVRWRHLQFAGALVLASFNWVGFLLNWVTASSLPNPYHHPYSIASFFSLALCLSFLLTALVANSDLSEELELDLQKTALVHRRQDEQPQRYTEL